MNSDAKIDAKSNDTDSTILVTKPIVVSMVNVGPKRKRKKSRRRKRAPSKIAPKLTTNAAGMTTSLLKNMGMDSI